MQKETQYYTILLCPLVPLVVPLSFQVGSTTPTPTIPQHQQPIHDWTPSLAICLTILQCTIWCHAAIGTLLQAVAPTSTATAVARALHLNSANDIYISFGRLFGVVFCLLGAMLRWLCYREMAHLEFTFHITVMEDHKLITTGPYAYVRHPSYTGGLLLDVGILIWHLAPGSWLRESGILWTAVFWILAAPSIVLMCFSTRMHFWRCRVEDDIMRKEFGRKWDEWACDVPYKLLPGVF